MAHSAGSFATARHHIDVAREFERVLFEITLTDVPLGAIELLVETVVNQQKWDGSGPERIVVMESQR